MERIHINKSENPKNDACGKLNEVLNDISRNQNKVLILLAGGSALDLLEGLDMDNLSPNSTVTVLDERYSKDPGENNFAQIINTGNFYKDAVDRGVRFIDTRVNDESQEELASRFNSALIHWFSENPGGKVVATVGIGPDGHISGMMPYPEDREEFLRLFEDKENLVVAYDAGDKNPFPKRVTSNMNLMRKINEAVVYAVGESKREALTNVLNETGSLEQTPARILWEMENVNLYTDLEL